MKLVTTRLKSGGLHEKHVEATWNLGNHLSICLQTQGNQEKPVSRWHTVTHRRGSSEIRCARVSADGSYVHERLYRSEPV